MSSSKLDYREDKHGKRPVDDVRPSRSDVNGASRKVSSRRATKFSFNKSDISSSHISSEKIMA